MLRLLEFKLQARHIFLEKTLQEFPSLKSITIKANFFSSLNYFNLKKSKKVVFFKINLGLMFQYSFSSTFSLSFSFKNKASSIGVSFHSKNLSQSNVYSKFCLQ